MAFLRSGIIQESTHLVRGRDVWLRAPSMGDYAAWAELRARSREHLTPWEPVWQRDELTRSSFRRRVRHYNREAREDLGYAFLIFRNADDELLGGLSLSNVRRGVTQAAVLGYWLGLPFVRQGHMTAAVAAVVAFAFEDLRLHRLEAATMPNNVPSIRVLERNGFRREGIARRLLKINGAWEDHVLHGLVADDAAQFQSAGEEVRTA
jgi:[ribosomal protein S5]-alanine N-acetyltransferase